MTSIHRPFLTDALITVYRALGLCDRAGVGETAGCCDRAHWHYRTSDIPNARAQETGLLLALAYDTQAPNNPFAANTQMETWIRDIWRFWLARQNRDGSVSEVYPFERSFCATAFSAAAFVETVALMGGAPAWAKELDQARKTFHWLAQNASRDAANQTAASVLALGAYAQLTGDAALQDKARDQRAAFIRDQLADGTFVEYDGLDVGYQTITLSTLARTLAYDDDKELRAALNKGEQAIRERFSEQGRHDSHANSRSTQFTYPYGLACTDSPALAGLLRGLDENVVLRPTWMDDRYAVPLAIDYFWTYRRLSHANDAV